MAPRSWSWGLSPRSRATCLVLPLVALLAAPHAGAQFNGKRHLLNGKPEGTGQPDNNGPVLGGGPADFCIEQNSCFSLSVPSNFTGCGFSAAVLPVSRLPPVG
jgi:hypothetical protein